VLCLRKQGKLIDEKICIVNKLKSVGKKIELRKNTYSQSIPQDILQITFPQSTDSPLCLSTSNPSKILSALATSLIDFKNLGKKKHLKQ